MIKTVIVVPVYNEGNRAVDTIKNILKLSALDVVVVNDGSMDNSYELLGNEFRANKRIVLLSHILNLGKGAAMKTGAEMAWKLGAKAVIYVDADGQHNPKHLPVFEKELIKNALVFGYRELDGSMPLIRKWGNKCACLLIKTLFNINRRDLLCGFLGFHKSVYKTIKWKSCRYGIETEMATKVGKNKLSFSEVKIDTIYLDKYKGVSMFDAIKILTKIPFWFFSK